MDDRDFIFGAVAWLGAKGLQRTHGWNWPTNEQRLDKEIEERTGLSIPTYETIQTSESAWCVEAAETFNKCIRALSELGKEINYLPVEVCTTALPITTTKECFVKPKRLGLIKSVWSKTEVYEVRLLGSEFYVEINISGTGERAFDKARELAKIKSKISRFRNQYWIVNIARYLAWCKKYLKSVYRESTYDLFVSDFIKSPEVWIDSPPVKIVPRTPSEIVYFDKVAAKIMEVSERALRAGFDWYTTKCGRMPSEEFLNEHGILSYDQYRNEQARR